MKKQLTIMLVLVMLFTLAACAQKADNPEASTMPSAESAGQEGEETVYTISAGGLELKYPTKWKDKVAVTVSDDKVSFVCNEVPLFDILFGGTEGFVLGTVCEDEYLVLRAVCYELNSDNAEAIAMQEDLNVILQHLMKDYAFVSGQALSKEDTSSFDIETSVVTMKYPEKWKDKVQIETGTDGVKFSCDGTPLFDLMFVECDGHLLGTYGDTPIYIVEYPVTTEEQAQMQDDVNVILSHLMEDSNFTIGDS